MEIRAAGGDCHGRGALGETEEARDARNVVWLTRLRRELNAWESRHGGEIQHIEAQVGLGQQTFSVRVWFRIGGLFVPTVYEVVRSPDCGSFTVYGQAATGGFYLWDRVLVTSAAKLTQALDAAYDSARIRRLYLGFPLKAARRKPTGPG